MSETAKKKKTTMTHAERVVAFGRQHIHKKVGRGECWDLPFRALQAAGAKTPWEIEGGDLYVWGQPVSDLREAKPGDILQFENVRIKRTWVTAKGLKATEEFNFGKRHSAIVEHVGKGMFFVTLNAHINRSKLVRRLRINLSPENIQQGKIFLYRPIPKK